jgi:hypothetical protein
MNYQEFIESKTQLGSMSGFEPLWMPDFLFDFQKHLTEWSIRKGRAAIFADCGLGKTPIELVWAQNVVQKENKPVLIICPLAVSVQHLREAEKFGIEAHRSHDGKAKPNITVTNYEQLHKFDPNDFSGAACDESSILKSFNGVRKQEITVFMRKMKYRLLATATAAPNDYIELGTSSEALGYMGYMDMLNRFFKNTLNNSSTGRYRGESVKWRFKGHAEIPFWKWVCSWARAIRKPSDLGFDDQKFILPPLEERQHIVGVKTLPDGFLFSLPACGLQEQRDERRRSIQERCERVAELVNGKKSALVWCHLNPEGDLLEKLIPGAVQVSGDDSDEAKEERLMGFEDGQVRVLVTKPKIAGWGLNFQQCSHVTFFPSHSYEQYYQGVRRCWRFGQKNRVIVDVVTTEGELNVLKNLQRKATQADKMFSNLVAEMNNALHLANTDNATNREEIPAWLKPKQ